jgi:hypothetical protein
MDIGFYLYGSGSWVYGYLIAHLFRVAKFC